MPGPVVPSIARYVEHIMNIVKREFRHPHHFVRALDPSVQKTPYPGANGTKADYGPIFV